MVGGDMFKGIVPGLIGFGIVIGLSVWGIVEFGHWVFRSDEDDAIRTEQRIEPDLEINVIDGKSDTTFVYRKPE